MRRLICVAHSGAGENQQHHRLCKPRWLFHRRYALHFGICCVLPSAQDPPLTSVILKVVGVISWLLRVILALLLDRIPLILHQSHNNTSNPILYPQACQIHKEYSMLGRLSSLIVASPSPLVIFSSIFNNANISPLVYFLQSL